MPLRSYPRRIRVAFDRVYDGAGFLAAACLLAMLVVIVLQMASRWSALSFHGSSEYAGYLMAAASFLGFAHALNRGAHIRVSLLLAALGPRRFWAELWGLLIAAATSGYLAWYAVKLVYWSHKLGDISQGQDVAPLWIVQLPVAAGAILLFISFLDNFAMLILTGRDNIGTDLVEQSRAE